MIADYFQHIEAPIALSGIVHSSSITYDKRSVSIGFIRGNIYFLDGSLLCLLSKGNPASAQSEHGD